jgi:hypothetical protein
LFNAGTLVPQISSRRTTREFKTSNLSILFPGFFRREVGRRKHHGFGSRLLPIILLEERE